MMHSNNRRWHGPTVQFSVARRLALLVSWTLPLCAVHADDRFSSDNKAQVVRSPVLAEPIVYDGPKKIQPTDLEGWKVRRAGDLELLKSLIDMDALVMGKVESVFIPSSQNKVILNLGRDFRSCFKVVIDIRDFEKWGTSEPKEIGKMFDGLNIAVDGLVSLHQKLPQIVVTLPHQLRIISTQRTTNSP